MVNAVASTNYIAPGWQPDADTLNRIQQLNIPQDFALSQVGEFVLYWRERNEPARAWGSKFLKHVLARWREQESKQAAKQRQNQYILIGARARSHPCLGKFRRD